MAASLAAQEIRVYSEFRRVDGLGGIVAADEGGRPREILSPAAPRNAFSSFRIIVTLPAGSDLHLDIGQNPDDAVTPTFYEESMDGRLTKVEIPFRKRLAGNQTTVSIWFDMWVRPGSPVDRVKVEPQLYFGGRWYIYPMEVRIIDPQAPPLKAAPVAPAPPGAPADAVARGLLRERFCGARPDPVTPGLPLTVWQLSRRNALQDLALVSNEQAGAALLKATAAASLEQWCKAPPKQPNGPEWYLRFRDLIYRAASKDGSP